MRSMLFTPGNKPGMMIKALSAEADAVIMDLEDSVPPDQKELARNDVLSVLEGKESSKKRYVRVNAIDTPWFLQEVLTFSRSSLDGIVIPKICRAADVEKVAWLLESAVSHRPSGIKIVPIVETAAGILNVTEIAGASPMVEAIMFGAIDYILDIEGDANDEFSLVAPKAMVVLACRANHVLPLDSVYPNFQDSMGLEIECRRSKAIGFAGKACIHPAQAATINGVFSYSVSEIAWAEKVVEAYKKAVRDGNGALNVNGSMVDLPVYEKATRILSLSSRKN